MLLLFKCHTDIIPSLQLKHSLNIIEFSCPHFSTACGITLFSQTKLDSLKSPAVACRLCVVY